MNTASTEDRTKRARPATRTRRVVRKAGVVAVLLTVLTGGAAAHADAQIRGEEEAITAVYEALTGRPATSDELAFWSVRIEGRSGRLELSWLLARDTIASEQISALYRDVLGREPGPDELLYWVRRSGQPGGLNGALALIAASAEALAYAGSRDAYVANLYRSLLGREPDVGGLRYWSGQVDETGSAGGAARALREAPEARGRRIREAYRRVLGREPDQGGYLYWLSSGYDEPAISAVLAASDEIWRPSLPGEMPFVFPGAVTLSTLRGEASVTFVVTFTERLAPGQFCEAVEIGLRGGGAHIETSCTADAPLVVGSYRGETLLLAASGRNTFTLTIGTPYG